MSDDLDLDLLREITFEPPAHLDAPPWPQADTAATRSQRWPAAAAILLAAAAAALLWVILSPPAAEQQQAAVLDDQLAIHAVSVCPPPGVQAPDPYCMGLR